MVSGHGRIYSTDLPRELHPGASIVIPAGRWHQLYAFSDMEIVEVQVGPICEESDIERLLMPSSTKEVI